MNKDILVVKYVQINNIYIYIKEKNVDQRT